MRILNAIRSSKTGYKLSRRLLLSPLLTENKIYDRIYTKKINKAINSLENSPPSTVEIGITNACNSDCIMCPHSKLKNIGFMKSELFEKIIDDCAKSGIKSVTLSFFGEALLDKKLIEKIKYAKSKGLRVGFFSNASLMNEIWAHKLIESGLDYINISFDAYKKETYEKIRKGLSFEITRENIKRLVELKKQLNSKTPAINLAFVELTENQGEIKDFYKDWKGKVQDINVLNMRNWAGQIGKESKSSFHFKSKDKRRPCSLIWQKMIVDWNGEVVLCCDDWNHSVVLGDLNKQTLMHVWNGEKLRKIRELHKKGEFNKIGICSNCNKKTVWWLIG